MNFDLMKGQTKLYLPYIKLIYLGLRNNIINVNVSNDLYRGALININEIQNLINHKKHRTNSGIPSGLIYCKSFMSFSLDRNVALVFMNRKTPSAQQIRVLYILKAEPGLDHKNATNADLNEISYFKNEREILLLPFSTYEISDIIQKENYFEIYLNYLGKYKELFNFKNETELFSSIYKSKFIYELELAGLYMPMWLAKKSLCRIRVTEDKYGSKIFCYGSGFCCSIPFNTLA